MCVCTRVPHAHVYALKNSLYGQECALQILLLLLLLIICCLHLTGTQSAQYKNNKVNKIDTQPRAQVSK